MFIFIYLFIYGDLHGPFNFFKNTSWYEIFFFSAIFSLEGREESSDSRRERERERERDLH
jgi:hypothetical protein